jgi:hypothetical protein
MFNIADTKALDPPPFIHHHHHQWHYSPEPGLALPYGFRDRKITIWVVNPTINLV